MVSAKSPKSKRSPGRPRKSTVERIEKSLEKPSQHIIDGFEGISFLFLLGAVAAAIAWMVYVSKFSINLYNEIDDVQTINENVTNQNVSVADVLTIEQYTICYQAVVAALLLYFAFKYHFAR